MGSDLKNWVSDRLMSVLGYSQPTVVQYVISMSKKASSPSEIASELEGMEVPPVSARTFAQEIFAKVERRTSGLSLYQKQEREAAMLVRRQSTYTILEDDNDDVDVSGSVGNNSVSSAASESRRKDTRKKRFRKKTENQDDEDDEA
ncbi:hypothetical protein LguiA_028292 [Lonicera macranthoides]